MALDGRRIERPGLASDVASVLRRAILAGELESGTRIVERDVAENLALSRGPIREALRLLEHEGLVEIAPRRGARVAAIEPHDIREIDLVRTAIEPVAVQLLLERADPSLLDPARSALGEMARAADRGDWAGINAADVALHESFYEQCGSRRLMRLWDSMRAPLLRVFGFHREVYGSPGAALDSHARLLELIASGAVETAQAAVRAHVRELADEALERATRAAHAPAN